MMFYLVDIHEVFANINGSDQLRKLLGKPLKSVAVARRSSGPVVHSIWVIPGHILVSLNDGTLLLAFDLLPKLRPWPSIPNLLLDPKTSTSPSTGPKPMVCNVLSYKDNNDVSYVLVICRKGKLISWKFTRPSYEWQFVGATELCKGSRTQIVSASFSNATNTLLWCERRTPTQCCICKSIFSNGVDNSIQLSGVNAVLHNCIPMQITLVDDSNFLFTPVAKTDQEILLFWESRSQTLQVFVWPFKNNEIIQPVKSSDYRSIVMDTLSFWINSDCDTILPFTFCVNHTSNELFVLQKDCRLYILTLNRPNNKPTRYYATTLQLGRWKENFKKKPAKLFTWNIFVGLLQYDGTILLFEINSGSCICVIKSLEKSLSKLWVCDDVISKAGFWNYSGLWILRAEPVTKQAEHLIRVLSGDKSYEGPYRLPLSHQSRNHVDVGTLSQTENVLKKQRSNSSIAIEALAELNFEMSSNEFIHVPLARACLSVVDYLLVLNMRHHASILVADIVCKSETELDFILSTKEISKLINLFDDPVMLLSVFYRKLIDKKLLNSRILFIVDQEQSNLRLSLSKGTLTLIKEYLYHSEKDVINHVIQGKNKDNISSIIENLIVSSLDSEPEILFVALKDMACISGKEFSLALVELLKLDDTDSIVKPTPKINGLVKGFNSTKLLWNKVLSKDGILFSFICNELFEHSVDYLHHFVLTSMKISDVLFPPENSKKSSTIMSHAQQAIHCLHLPSKDHHQYSVSQSRLCAYVNLLLMTDSHQKEFEGLKIYLDNKLYESAFSLLEDQRMSTKKHKLLFHTICKHLLRFEMLGKYATKLSNVVPDEFTMIEFSSLARSIFNADHNLSKDIFDSNSLFSISELRPLLDVLISRQSLEHSRNNSAFDK